MIRGLRISSEKFIALVESGCADWLKDMPGDARIVAVVYEQLPAKTIELRIFSERYDTDEPLELRERRLGS